MIVKRIIPTERNEHLHCIYCESFDIEKSKHFTMILSTLNGLLQKSEGCENCLVIVWDKLKDEDVATCFGCGAHYFEKCFYTYGEIDKSKPKKRFCGDCYGNVRIND